MAFNQSPFAKHAREVVTAIHHDGTPLTLAQRNQLQRELERAYETLFEAGGSSFDAANIIADHFAEFIKAYEEEEDE